MTLRIALFALLIGLAVPAATAAAQPTPIATGTLFCKWFPAWCAPTPEPEPDPGGGGGGGGGGDAVPELGGNAAATALALLAGTALLITTRRRRKRA